MKIYCPAHIKDHVNINKWVGGPQTKPSAATFVPVTKTIITERREASAATADRVKKFKEGADSTKCNVCGKTVYMAEKLDIEMRGEKKLFHKLCVKCSVCNVILNLRTYDSLNGILYCKSHLPTQQQAKNAFFVSPLHVNNDEMLQKLSIDRVEGIPDTMGFVEQPAKPQDQQQQSTSQPTIQEPKPTEQPKAPEKKELTEEEARDEERRKRREEAARKRQEDEKKEEEEAARRVREREDRRRSRQTTPLSDNSSSATTTTELTDEEKKRQREERRKQREEEAKKEEEEAAKKSEERRKRFSQLKMEKVDP